MSILINRKEEIKKKGFTMNLANDTQDVYSQAYKTIDFSKIRVGVKTLDDAILELGNLNKQNPRLADKKTVLNAIDKNNYELLREISNYFYKTSGIYNRLCRYMAYMYRYDWMITPYIVSDNLKEEKVLDTFHKALTFLDNFEVKRFFGEVALKVLRNGCYYGYIIPQNNTVAIQELSPNYCRSRFSVRGRPAVEFNMKWFDDKFKDTAQKMQMLKLFPAEFRKGYVLYKEGKLVPQFAGDTSSWYLLDINSVIKFTSIYICNSCNY